MGLRRRATNVSLLSLGWVHGNGAAYRETLSSHLLDELNGFRSIRPCEFYSWFNCFRYCAIE